MGEQLRLGIVGCGDIAGYSAFFARLNRRIRLKACCDLDAQRARRFARRFGIPQVFTDFEVMLAQAALDAVYLAVPHHLHAGMLDRTTDAHLHCLVEKPITCTLQQGRQAAEKAALRGVKIGVNYQYRYDGGCYALARAAQRGELGRLLYARANLPWQRSAAYFENSPWHARMAQACGGTLLTQGSHLLDILLWAMGSQAAAATGVTRQARFSQTEVEDLAMATIEMENGALLQMTSSMVAVPEQPILMEVYGEKGTAVYTDRPIPRLRFIGCGVKKEKPPIFGVHALQRSLEGFRAWVMDGVPYLAPAEAALPVLAAVEAIYRSAKSGSKEMIAPTKTS